MNFHILTGLRRCISCLNFPNLWICFPTCLLFHSRLLLSLVYFNCLAHCGFVEGVLGFYESMDRSSGGLIAIVSHHCMIECT